MISEEPVFILNRLELKKSSPFLCFIDESYLFWVLYLIEKTFFIKLKVLICKFIKKSHYILNKCNLETNHLTKQEKLKTINLMSLSSLFKKN